MCEHRTFAIQASVHRLDNRQSDDSARYGVKVYGLCVQCAAPLAMACADTPGRLMVRSGAPQASSGRVAFVGQEWWS